MWMQAKSTQQTIGTILYDATGAFTIKKGKFVDKKVTE
jgi:hypothetical protein